MKAILLAAGKGTRLSPYSDELPKCLMPIKGRPLLEYWLQSLKTAGVTEVLVNTHYLAEAVEEYLKHNTLFPLGESCHIVYEPCLLGTAGTLFKVRDYWHEQTVLVAHADNFFNFSLEKLIAAHNERHIKTCITMALFTTDNPENCGIVVLDKEGVVIGFYEKQVLFHGNSANAAIYMMEPDVAEYHSESKMLNHGGEGYDISLHLIPELIEKIQGWHIDGELVDIGLVNNWVRAQSMKTSCDIVSDTPWHQCYQEHPIHNQLQSLIENRV